jgi:peroxiredoxin
MLSISLIFMVVLGKAIAMGTRDTAKDYLNREAPDFSLYDLNGRKVTLSDFKNRNNVILFFWATWCMFCREEINYLNNRYDELEEKEIVVLAIDVDESGKAVRRFLINKPIRYKILLDKDAKVAFDYGLNGVPTYVVIDKKGIIKYIENSFPIDYQDFISEDVHIKQ